MAQGKTSVIPPTGVAYAKSLASPDEGSVELEQMKFRIILIHIKQFLDRYL